jgi:hypothetical protein
MAFNIVTEVQERLGLDPFEKINPNFQETSTERPEHYAQAATIAVLTGLYKYAQDKEGAIELLHPDYDRIPDHIFKQEKNRIVDAVDSYDHELKGDTLLFMQKIARAAVEILHTEAKSEITLDSKVVTPELIETILAGQRHHILSYLPPDLQLGKAMNDRELDSRTNKMEGPVSNLMHFIENIFSDRTGNRKVTHK